MSKNRGPRMSHLSEISHQHMRRGTGRVINNFLPMVDTSVIIEPVRGKPAPSIEKTGKLQIDMVNRLKREVFKKTGVLPDNFPIWVIEQSAQRDINDFYSAMSPTEREAFDQREIHHGMVFMMVEISHIPVGLLFINQTCEHFPILLDKLGSALPRDEHIDMTLISVEHEQASREFIKREGNRCAKLSRRIIRARELFSERYVEVIRDKPKERPERLLNVLTQAPTKPIEPVVITVHWDAPTPRYVYREHPDHVPVHRGPVCEHDVRGFIRHMKSGKEVFVRAHKRGDPSVARKSPITRII